MRKKVPKKVVIEVLTEAEYRCVVQTCRFYSWKRKRCLILYEKHDYEKDHYHQFTATL